MYACVCIVIARVLAQSLSRTYLEGGSADRFASDAMDGPTSNGGSTGSNRQIQGSAGLHDLHELAPERHPRKRSTEGWLHPPKDMFFCFPADLCD